MNAEKIKTLRKRLYRTQEGMAKIVGVHPVTWARWEAGAITPLPAFIEKLEKLWAFTEKQEREER